MFKFLKKKISETINKLSKKTEEEGQIESIEKNNSENYSKEEIKEEKEKKIEKKKEKNIKIKKEINKEKDKKEVEKKNITKNNKINIKEKKEDRINDNIKNNIKVKSIFENKKTVYKEELHRKKNKEAEKRKEKIIEEKKEYTIDLPEKNEKEEKSFFKGLKEKLTKVKLSEEKFEELFWDLEIILLENNVALEVIEKIKNDLKEALTTGKVTRGGINKLIRETLKKSIKSLFAPGFDLISLIKEKKEKPFIILFLGVNGSGKTTTLAKIANLLQENDLKTVIAASDTFRAAAIDQLEEHAKKLGIKIIKQDYGSDPAAVAFDAVSYAKSHNLDVVLIDTAGRLHSNKNLMAELEKIVRVAKPDLKIFIGESITGNDCVEQAKEFNKRIGFDGIILSKADVDEKGGAAISISYVTKKPILYLGVGQSYGDLELFDKEKIIKNLDL